jgi:hypothetical protein
VINQEGQLESDLRFYRRRATEELAAADRAITQAARERRLQLAGVFLQHLSAAQKTGAPMFEWGRESISA